MPSAVRSVAARETEWRGEQTCLEMAGTRTWCSQNSERHIKLDGSLRTRVKMHMWSVPTENPPWRGCCPRRGVLAPEWGDEAQCFVGGRSQMLPREMADSGPIRAVLCPADDWSMPELVSPPLLLPFLTTKRASPSPQYV